MQDGFYRYAIYYGLLLKEHLPKTQEKLKSDCLEHYYERSLKSCDWSNSQICFYWQEKLE